MLIFFGNETQEVLPTFATVRLIQSTSGTDIPSISKIDEQWKIPSLFNGASKYKFGP